MMKTQAPEADLLRQTIERHAPDLLRSIRLFVLRFGLAHGKGAEEAAHELLSEVTVEALSHAGRAAEVRDMQAWLMGIALNLIKRRRRGRAVRMRREPLALDLFSRAPDDIDEGAVFARLLAAAENDPAREIETQDTLAYLLAPLSPEDRYIVRLAVILEMDGAGIAQELGIKPGTARVRLHRAIRRLAKAWAKEGLHG